MSLYVAVGSASFYVDLPQDATVPALKQAVRECGELLWDDDDFDLTSDTGVPFDDDSVPGLEDGVYILAVPTERALARQTLRDRGIPTTGRALRSAAWKGDLETCRLLLEVGVDADSSALVCAAESGAADVISLLHEHGSACDVTTSSGWTPLAYAAQRAHVEACQVLLGLGSDPQKAISIAAKAGHSHVVSLLLSHGMQRTVIPVEQP